LRDTAYLLTDDESGFWIVDVSQPQLPQILSFFETAVPIDFLREWNGRFYIGPTDDELDTPIFSIDDPHHPILIGELPYEYIPLTNDEYVANIREDNESEMTISIADATDLNNLRSVSEVTIDFDGYFIDADQDQYYFLNFEHGPTLWVMVKDDSTHSLIELDIEMSPYVGSIQVKDHIIYMQENFSDAGSYGSSVYAFNVSKPRQIRELNRLRTGNRNFDLFIDENMVYVAAGEGLVIAEISEDSELHKLAEWRSLGDLAWIDANTHQVFALNSWDNRIFQFELSPPQHLQLMYEHLGERIDEVVLAGDIVFTTGWFDGIRRYESNMMPWQETVIFDTSPSTEFVRDMAVQGETLYALLDGDLGVLDISNPEHLLQIGELERLSNSYGALVVDNNHLFTWTENANEFKGLQAVSIANPVKPEQIGFWHDNLDSHLSGLFAHEDFVYLLTRCYKNGCNDESLLQIINVSNPDNMFVAGSLLISGMVSDITLLDSKLLLGGDKLRLVDITNPAQPQLISELDTPGYVYDVVVRDNLMYVADYAGGLLVLRLVE
jgi:hypothetical protein